MIQIHNHDNLTDEFIMNNISDNSFQLTLASRTFLDKNIFIRKIHDKTIRYKMLKEILFF